MAARIVFGLTGARLSEHLRLEIIENQILIAIHFLQENYIKSRGIFNNSQRCVLQGGKLRKTPAALIVTLMGRKYSVEANIIRIINK